MVLDSTVPQISGLADSVYCKCGNLAANETLEPAHAVICKLLRTGADFSRAVSLNPIYINVIAITPYPQLDIDGVLQKKITTKPCFSPTPRTICGAFANSFYIIYNNLSANYHCSKHEKLSCPSTFSYPKPNAVLLI